MAMNGAQISPLRDPSLPWSPHCLIGSFRVFPGFHGTEYVRSDFSRSSGIDLILRLPTNLGKTLHFRHIYAPLVYDLRRGEIKIASPFQPQLSWFPQISQRLEPLNPL